MASCSDAFAKLDAEICRLRRRGRVGKTVKHGQDELTGRRDVNRERPDELARKRNIGLKTV